MTSFTNNAIVVSLYGDGGKSAASIALLRTQKLNRLTMDSAMCIHPTFFDLATPLIRVNSKEHSKL